MSSIFVNAKNCKDCGTQFEYTVEEVSDGSTCIRPQGINVCNRCGSFLCGNCVPWAGAKPYCDSCAKIYADTPAVNTITLLGIDGKPVTIPAVGIIKIEVGFRTIVVSYKDAIFTVKYMVTTHKILKALFIIW